MEESAEEAQKRDELLRIYHSTKEALKIIGEVSSMTISTPTPPAISYDRLQTPQNNYPERPASPKQIRQAPMAPSKPASVMARPAPPAPSQQFNQMSMNGQSQTNGLSNLSYNNLAAAASVAQSAASMANTIRQNITPQQMSAIGNAFSNVSNILQPQ